jgi:hypothetical protein
LRGGVDGSEDGGGSTMTLSPNRSDEGGGGGSDAYKRVIRERERNAVPFRKEKKRNGRELI